MKRAILMAGICIIGVSLAGISFPLLQQRAAAAVISQTAPARQVEAPFASLDPILQDVATELHGRFAKPPQGLPERTISWTTKTGTAMTMTIRVAGMPDKPKLITMLEAQSNLQEMSQSFNLQYLNLQQQMQDENRRFTLVSNIMKTKHDTAKNSISNIR